MKRGCLVLLTLLLVLGLLVGCFTPILPPPPPKASFQITSWEQDYYEYFQEYAYVYIYFRITNTGAVDIDYYEVYFEVKCRDGSTYQDWTNGLNVKVGKSIDDWTLINTAKKEAILVTVSDYDLTSYSF